MRRKIISAILLISLLFSLAACQPAPEKEVVVSKNDGAFEQAITTDAGENGGVSTQAENGDAPNSAAAESTAFSYTDSFTSTDGKIAYNINAQVDVPTVNMPIVQVRPMVINGPKARQIVQALFGDAPIYEKTNEKSKSEWEDLIISISNWTSDEAIRQAHGDNLSQDEIESIRASRQSILDSYKAAYEEAREVVPKEECQFRFYREFTRYSFDGAGAYADEPSYYEDIPYGQGYELQAVAEMDSIRYHIWFNNREADDFRNHSVSVFIEETGGPDIMNEYKRSVGLLSEEAPTAEQIAAAEQKAREMLSAMEIGDWQVKGEEQHNDFTESEDTHKDYFISVQCLPVYEGVVVTRQQGLSNIKSTNEYASNYYYEELNFQLSNDGRLLSFHYTGPLELVQVVNANVPVMSMAEIQQRVHEQLILSDLDSLWEYNRPGVIENMFGGAPMSAEELAAQRAFFTAVSAEYNITSVEIGLARTRIKDNKTDFYLVPAVTLRGQSTILNAQGDNLGVIAAGVMPGQDTTILGLNLVDGTVLMLQNPND